MSQFICVCSKTTVVIKEDSNKKDEPTMYALLEFVQCRTNTISKGIFTARLINKYEKYQFLPFSHKILSP